MVSFKISNVQYVNRSNCFLTNFDTVWFRKSHKKIIKTDLFKHIFPKIQ